MICEVRKGPDEFFMRAKRPRIKRSTKVKINIGRGKSINITRSEILMIDKAKRTMQVLGYFTGCVFKYNDSGTIQLSYFHYNNILNNIQMEIIDKF